MLQFRPNKQLNLHRPGFGIYGDCYRTAISCLLGVEPEEVPHFWNSQDQTGGEIADMMNQWLIENHGVGLFTIPCNGQLDVQEFLDAMGKFNSGYYLLTGKSKNDVSHNVVCKGGEIIHDPALDNSGITGPCDDGLYWLDILTPVIK